MKPKILIVEDMARYQLFYRERLKDMADILAATNLDDGRRIFDDNPDVTLVVMDACVPGDMPNSMVLVKHIRRSFSGPMIAASSDPDYTIEKNW